MAFSGTGTSGAGRICIRYHTLDVAFIQGGALKSDLHFMGDFGRSAAVQQTTAPVIDSCADDQNAFVTTGTRHINLAPDNGYEPWRLDERRLVLGFHRRDFTLDTGDAQTGCVDFHCAALAPRYDNLGQPNRGTDHRFRASAPLSITLTLTASGS